MLEMRAKANNHEIEMEEENPAAEDHGRQHRGWQQAMSPEIVEIGDDSRSMVSSSRDGGVNDIYIAVGKNDLDVVKWALNNAVSPGARVFLVHVFPPVTYFPTPVGKLSRNQLSQEEVQIYINEENNRRRNQLQKYIRLFSDAKVAVETMLVESNATSKAILELIPVVNITNLVMGTKRPFSRRSRWGIGKGEFVQKSAPKYCEVTIVYEGKMVTADHQKPAQDSIPPRVASWQRPGTTQHSERNFFDYICFSGKFI